MSSKTLNLILLVSLTSCIYLLRENHIYPTNLLSNLVFKFLQEQRPSEILCKGVDLNNDVSETDLKYAEQARSSLSNLRDGNPFIQFIEGPEPREKFKDDYIVPALVYAAPWIVFFGLSILGFLFYILNWCCMYVPSCGCIDACKRPKTNKNKNCYIILSLVFMAFVFGASVAGLVLSRGISKGGNGSICKTALIIEELADGSSKDHWVGIRPTANKLVTVLDNFNSTLDRIEKVNSNFDELDNKIQAAKDAVSRMYEQNKNKIVSTRPDPAIGGTYVPTYIKNLGPTSNQANFTGTLQLEMEAKSILVREASRGIDYGIDELRSKRATYQKYINDGRDFAQLVSDSVSSFLDKTQEFGIDAQNYVHAADKAVLIVLAIEVICAAVAVSSIVLVCCGLNCFNKFIHLSWCAIGLLMILTWAISAFLFPLSLAVFEGCEVAEKAITDSNFYDKAIDKFFVSEDPNIQRAKNTLRTCLFGSGDLLEQLQLQGKIEMFDPIFKALDNTANLTDITKRVPDSLVIPVQQEIIQGYKEGNVPDSQETIQDLAKLNTFTYLNSKKCTQVRDKWVLNSDQCTSSSEAVFADNSSPNFNLNNPTCIGYDTWGDKIIDDRYTSQAFPQSCGKVGNDQTNVYVANFIDRFASSRQEVSQIFTDLETSLDNVAVANSDFMQSVKGIVNSFDPIRNQTLAIYKALADRNEGIIYNANCSFIKDSVLDLHKSLCVVLISSVFETSVAVIVLSFMGFFGTFVLFCLAKRFTVKEERSRRDGRQIHHYPKA